MSPVTGRVVPAVWALVWGRHARGQAVEFRTGPLWAWCAAEQRRIPHQVDAGGRRCLSCKTITEEEFGG